jgi:hypothetical protein
MEFCNTINLPLNTLFNKLFKLPQKNLLSNGELNPIITFIFYPRIGEKLLPIHLVFESPKK